MKTSSLFCWNFIRKPVTSRDANLHIPFQGYRYKKMTPLKSRDSKLSIDTIQSWLTRMRTNNASFPHLFARIAALIHTKLSPCFLPAAAVVVAAVAGA